MLILTRKPGETIAIGKNIQISVLEIEGRSVKLGIEAPKSVTIYRGEIYQKVQEQNRQAVLQGTGADLTLIAGELKKNMNGLAENQAGIQSCNSEENFNE